eukprot:m.3247 g.3247  ORF g.3247 m.3247 type:complete len:89 (-) comp2037_c0_seq1:1996-2262(-)
MNCKISSYKTTSDFIYSSCSSVYPRDTVVVAEGIPSPIPDALTLTPSTCTKFSRKDATLSTALPTVCNALKNIRRVYDVETFSSTASS